MTDLNEINDLFQILGSVIPEGTNKEFELNGTKVTLVKENGDTTIKVVKDEKFDDSEVVKVVNNFKDNIKLIDDCLFVEINEEADEEIDIKEFDKLLNQEHFDKDSAIKVIDMIDVFSEITRSHLQKEVERLVNLYERF